MGVAVVTVAAGGMPVVDVTATTPGLGMPVTEAANGRGIPVTKVTLPKGGVPVTYVATTLQREAMRDDRTRGDRAGAVAGEENEAKLRPV